MQQPLPRKPNVLAVDDIDANLIALQAVLGRENNLICVDSGPAALSILQSRRDVDVILMDVQMPGMDGFETAAKIRKIEGYADVPLIFITGVYREDPFVARGYQVGGVDYFSKPFDPDILRRKVSIYSSFKLKDEMLKERERYLQESEDLIRVGKKLSSMLESLPIGVLITDAEGIVHQTTEEASRILNMAGLSYAEALGWWDAEGRMLKQENGPLWRTLREGKATHGERVQLEPRSGSRNAITVSVYPLRHLDGRIAGAVVLVHDLTESGKIAASLDERVARLVGVGVELEESRRAARPH